MNKNHFFFSKILIFFLLIYPLIIIYLDLSSFYIDFLIRIMILSIATISLDLLVGYCGLVSLGHALFLGIGSYIVVFLNYLGIENIFFQLLISIFICGLVSLITGALSLRTKGLYFIMITLGFAQIFYYFFSSLELLGGDNGININRSKVFGLIDLYNLNIFYFIILFFLILQLFFCHYLINSKYGYIIKGIKMNESRMTSLGYFSYKYKLKLYTIAGIMCGVSGVFYANLNEFVSPSYMYWTRSAEFLVIVILGGVGTLLGPFIGTIIFLIMEEYIPIILNFFIYEGAGRHWMIILGPILIMIVFFSKGGILGLISPPKKNE